MNQDDELSGAIALAQTDDEIRGCFGVVLELRTHLADAEEFLRRVRQQMTEGFRLVYLEDEGEVRAVGGFRIFSALHEGRQMHVDDLVTDGRYRSRGYGDRLFDWLVAYARAEKCKRLRLDSGVHRFAAHRFYLRKRMSLASHHFVLDL